MSANLMTVGEVAEYLNVKPRWVYYAVSNEQIPFVRLGRNLRFDADDIDLWLAENKSRPAPPA